MQSGIESCNQKSLLLVESSSSLQFSLRCSSKLLLLPPILLCPISVLISMFAQKVRWWQSKMRPKVHVRHNLATRWRLLSPPPAQDPCPLSFAAAKSLLPPPPPPLWLIVVLFCLHLPQQLHCPCLLWHCHIRLSLQACS
jgi:hypothetical protein